jgi:hypothetical protein
MAIGQGKPSNVIHHSDRWRSAAAASAWCRPAQPSVRAWRRLIGLDDRAADIVWHRQNFCGSARRKRAGPLPRGNQVRTRLAAGGKWIRTLGPAEDLQHPWPAWVPFRGRLFLVARKSGRGDFRGLEGPWSCHAGPRVRSRLPPSCVFAGDEAPLVEIDRAGCSTMGRELSPVRLDVLLTFRAHDQRWAWHIPR